MRDERAGDVTRRVGNSLIAKRLTVSYLSEVVSGGGIGRRRSHFDYNISFRCDEAGRNHKMITNRTICAIRILPFPYSRLGLHPFVDVSGDRAIGDCSRINRRSVLCHVCLATRPMHQGQPPMI
jgi:hypothetical protein